MYRRQECMFLGLHVLKHLEAETVPWRKFDCLECSFFKVLDRPLRCSEILLFKFVTCMIVSSAHSGKLR